MRTGASRLLWRYVAPHAGAAAFAVACVILANLAVLCGPYVLRHAIDDLTAGVTQGKLLGYGGALVLVALAAGVFQFFQRRAVASASRALERSLADDFYAHLQRLPREFYAARRTGDLMARATSDVAAVRVILGGGILYGANAFFALALTLPFMAFIDWRLTLLSSLSIPLTALATKVVSRRIHDESLRVQEHFGEVSNRVQESLAGVRVIRAYRQERAELENFKRVNRELVGRNLRLARVTAGFSPVLRFCIGLGFVVAFWYGGLLAARGTITIGQFVQFMIYFELLVMPTLELGHIVNVFQRGAASMRRLEEIMSAEPSVSDADADRGVRGVAGEIEFRRLTFAYEGSSGLVLTDVSLRIEAGQTVAFVGAVGAGKTTLVNLVPRLLDAPPGQVLIDGRPAREIPLGVLRSSIGYVPQETFLFGDTLRENIAFGAEGATQEEIERAALEAGLAEDIGELPQGYETLVGERGVTLSGGQKQRVALARAIVRRPRILILDDALSAVDTRTEERILRHLRRGMRRRTSLIVSHRVSTVRDADLICVLEGGRIVERGTHDELLAGGGLYARLYEKQQLENELSAG